MNCIIPSAIRPLANKYNVSTSDMKIAIYNWMNIKNVEEFDENKPEFKKYLDNYFLNNKIALFDNKKNYNKAIKIWNKLDNGVLKVNDLSKLESLLNDLQEGFGKENILVFNDAKENTCIKIAKPVFISNSKIRNASVIWAHPGTGKTWMYNQGRKDIIDFDSEYKSRLGNLEERANLKKKIGKTAYNQKLDELFEEAKEEANKTSRKLLVSDMHFLRDRVNDLDLVTNISNEEFIKRSHQRGEHNEADKMEWKNSINEAMKNVPSKKVLNTTGYISDLIDNNIGLLAASDDVMFHIKKSEIPIIKEQIQKKNPNLTTEAINDAIDFLNSLENNPELNLYVKYCIKWLKNGSILLPQDNDTVIASFKLAREYKMDLQKFNTPFDLIQSVLNQKFKAGEVKEAQPINPREIKEFHIDDIITNEDGETVEIYDVDDTPEGRLALSQAIADTTPKGKHGEWVLGDFTSPWCLGTFNYHADTGKVTRTESADRHWEHYNKDKRQVAFVNGFPIAFRSTSLENDTQWWSYKDEPFRNVKMISSKDRITTLDRFQNDRYEYNMFVTNGIESSFINDQLTTISKDNIEYKGNYIRVVKHISTGRAFESDNTEIVIRNNKHFSNELLNLIEFDRRNISLGISYGNEFSFNRIYGSNLYGTINKAIITGAFYNKRYNITRELDKNKCNELLNLIEKVGTELKALDQNIKNKPDFVELNETIKEDVSKMFELYPYFEKESNMFNEEVEAKKKEEWKAQRKTYAQSKKAKTQEQRDAARYNARNQVEVAVNNQRHREYDDIRVQHRPEPTNNEYAGEYNIETEDNETQQQIINDDKLRNAYNKFLHKEVIPELEDKLKNILTEYHIEYIYDDLKELFGDDVLGAFDILNKVVYLSNNGDINALTGVEEFSHAFVELMGSAYHKAENRDKYPASMVYSQLRDEVEKTTLYQQILEEYKDNPNYQYDNGKPDLAKIKKEALGKALATAIVSKFNENKEEEIKDKDFFEKILSWFKEVAEWFKKQLTEAGIKKIDATIDNVAESILNGTYKKLFLNHISEKGLKNVGYESTLENAPQEAKNIMQSAVRNGGLITGSLSVRKQSPLYRKDIDKLHDIDIMVPLNIGHEFFDRHPRFRQLNRVPENFRITNEQLVEDVKQTTFMQNMMREVPNLNVMYAYSDNEGNLIVNAIVCEDQSLVDRFMGSSGNFNSRLNNFTKAEREKMYLIDFFYRKDNDYVDNAIEDQENNLKLTNYKASFKAKLKYGRAKDVFDYQRLNPSNRVIKTRQQNNESVQNEDEAVNEIDSLLRRATEQRRRENVQSNFRERLREIGRQRAMENEENHLPIDIETTSREDLDSSLTEEDNMEELLPEELNSFLDRLHNESLNNVNEEPEVLYQLKKKEAKNTYKIETYDGIWTREEINKQKDKVFLFGDNTEDRLKNDFYPSKTQAVIRGLDNAIGIDTKKNRRENADSFFTNDDFDVFKARVDEAIQEAIASGKTIVLPKAGIGTGKADLANKASKLFNYLNEKLQELKNTSKPSVEKQIQDFSDYCVKHFRFNEEAVIKDGVEIAPAHSYSVIDENGEQIGVATKTASSFVIRDNELYYEPKHIDDYWGIPSTNLGSTVDQFGRDFLDGKLKDNYPNLNNDEKHHHIDNLKQDFQLLKDYYANINGKDENGKQKEGFTLISADSERFPMVVKATFKVLVYENKQTGEKKYETRTEYVGGSMDILGYNKETGEICILDMKNKRSNNNLTTLKHDYAGQQNLYLAMVSSISSKIDSVTDLWADNNNCLKILQFNGGEKMYREGVYTVDKNKQLTYKSTNELIQNMNDFNGPRLVLYDKETPEKYAIPVVDAITDQIEALTDEELVSMYGPGATKAEVKTKIIDEVVNNGQGSVEVSEENRQSNNLYNGYMKDSDILELSNSIIDEASSIYDVLMLRNEKAREWYTKITGIKLDDPDSKEYKHYEKDVMDMDRDSLMNEIPIQSVFNYIKENKFKKFSTITYEQLHETYEDGTPIYTNEEIYIATCKRIAYENFDELVNIGNGRFMLLEGKSLVWGVDPEELHQSGEAEVNVNIEDVSNKDLEHWMIQQASNKASLSREWRRILSKIKKVEMQTDAEGNPVKKLVKNKWGFNEKLNADVVINNFLTWFKECTDVDEMVDILTKRQEFYPEYTPILDLINKDDKLKSKFFQNFRKDFNIYSITLVDYDFKTKKTSYTIKVINNSSASDYILSDLGYKFATKSLDFLKNIDYGILTEVDKHTYLNKTNIGKLKTEVGNVRKLFDIQNTKSFTNPENIKKLKELLDKFGLNISIRTLSIALQDAAENNKGTAYSVENIVSKTLGQLTTMLNILNDRVSPVDFSLFKEEPNDKKDEISIRGFYKTILNMFGDYMEEVVEASTYENGKMHYSFNPPSYAGKLFINLRSAMSSKEKFDEFINDEYGKYKWFNENADSNVKEKLWMTPWLDILYDKNARGELSEKAIKARKTINRKTQLSYNKTPYVELGGLSYAKSILSEFYVGNSSAEITEANYHMPMMANKPASEFVSFLRFGSSNYKQTMLPYFYKIFTQELMRMRTVIERAENDKIEKIKFYDLTDKWKSSYPEVYKKFNKQVQDKTRTRTLEYKDLKTMAKTGVEFKFLSFLNDIKNPILKEYVVKYLNNTLPSGYDTTEVENSFKEEFTENMKDLFTHEKAYYEALGLFETNEEPVKDQEGKIVKNPDGSTKMKVSFKHFDFLKLPDSSFEDQKVFVDSELENFVWNDFLASINIIELTATDLAYYKNVEDFQKRFAQIHAPGLRLNIKAKALINEKMSKELNGRVSDGWSRTAYIKDKEYNTGIEKDVEIAFNVLIRKAKENKDFDKAESLTVMKSIVKAALKGVNVADAQALTSPTGMMKKLTMAGSWTDDMTEAYTKICNGDFNLNDLNVLIQPLKPFVYSQIQKNSNANTMSSLKVGLQNKNSEYMILLSDAIMRGANKKNKLMALFDFMESSAYDGRIIYRGGNVYKDNIKLRKTKYLEYDLETVLNKYGLTVEKLKDLKDGHIIDKGVYNGHGIDTIQFESAVKVGLQGVIDLNGKEGEELEYSEIIRRLKRTSRSFKSGDYRDKYVHTFSYKDYAIQQEVPAHMRDHRQLMGSQERILNISDMPFDTPFEFATSVFLDGQKGRKVFDKAGDVINRYQELVAANIDESYKELMEEFGLDKNKPECERNKIVSKLLLSEMSKDARYGADLRRACMIDQNTGKFIIPLSDPIQSMRIQQLIHSIIKSRINKQRVAGGPVVQASSWGLSEKLNIRWKGEKNDTEDNRNASNNRNTLDSRDEFKPSKKYPTYEEYLAAKFKKLAYFECAAPVPSEKLERDLILLAKRIDGSDYNGRLATPDEAVKYGLMSDSQLRAIGYRIPTEDKYSMYPMKIVAWVPRSAGEVIILPEEITKLTGSDFDIDKTYIYLQEYARTINEEALKDLIKRNTGWDDKIVDQEAENWINGEKTMNTALIDGFIAGLSLDIRTKFVSYERINTNNRSGRNNEIFDIQWKMLTHPSTIDKLFNPGSFDPQKKTARIIQIRKLDRENKYKYKDLADMDLDDLESLLGTLTNNEDNNICYCSTQVKFQQQNMTAGKLIGIFANNNVSHAFVQMQDIWINFNPDYHMQFCGVDFGESMKIDNIYALSQKDYENAKDLPKVKTYISKNIAGFLAASVDAVKDPVLNYLNLNTFTSGVAMLLARLGFDVDSIGLFLAQPIIEDAARLYANKNNDGYISITDAITECLNNANPKWRDTIGSNEVETPINKENLSAHLNDYKKSNFQVECLKLFYKLADPANSLNDLTFLTKFNSVSNAAGPSIADTIILKRRKDRFDESMRSDGFHPFNDNALDVIENSPILKAFYERTVGKNGAAEVIFKQWFPHYTKMFIDIISEYENSTKSPLDEKTLNKLTLEFLLYKLTLNTSKRVGDKIETIDGVEYVTDNGVRVCKITKENKKRFFIEDNGEVYFDTTFFKSDDKTRGAFINRFPEWFVAEREKLRNKHPELNNNQLLNTVTLKTGTKKLNLYTLEAKTGGFSSEVQEEVKNSWSELLEHSDPDVVKLGKDLFYYCLFRNGFGFSPKTFIHLASVKTKLNIGNGYTDEEGNNYLFGYINLINDLEFNEDAIATVSDFLYQFKRNHWKENRVVPNYKFEDFSKNVIISPSKRDGKNVITFTANKTKSDLNLLLSANKLNPITMVKYDNKLYSLYNYDLDSKNMIEFFEIKPLGFQNNFLEYDINKSWPESVISDKAINDDSADNLPDGSETPDNGEFSGTSQKSTDEAQPKTHTTKSFSNFGTPASALDKLPNIPQQTAQTARDNGKQICNNVTNNNQQ